MSSVNVCTSTVFPRTTIYIAVPYDHSTFTLWVGIKHFLLHGDMFVQLKSIEFSQERQALGCSLTKGATHLALTFKEKGLHSNGVLYL